MSEYQMIVLVRDGNGRGGDILRHQFYFRAAEKRTGEKFGDIRSAINLRLNNLNPSLHRSPRRKKWVDGVGNIKWRTVARRKAATCGKDARTGDFSGLHSVSNGNGIGK